MHCGTRYLARVNLRQTAAAHISRILYSPDISSIFSCRNAAQHQSESTNLLQHRSENKHFVLCLFQTICGQVGCWRAYSVPFIVSAFCA